MISSFRIESGHKLEVWEHDNYQGSKKSYTNDVEWIGNAWNDFISSVKCTYSGDNPVKYLSLMIDQVRLGETEVMFDEETAMRMTSTFSSRVITENTKSTSFEVNGAAKFFTFGVGISKDFSNMRRTEDFEKSTIAKEWRKRITAKYYIPKGKVYICAQEMAMYIFSNLEGEKKRIILPTNSPQLCGPFGKDELKAHDLDGSFELLSKTKPDWGLQTKTDDEIEEVINVQNRPAIGGLGFGGNSDWDYCTSSSPCPEGYGDCDYDSHCAEDLVCGKDNCRSINKGMGAKSAADCCVEAGYKGTVEVRFSTENGAGSTGDHYLKIKQEGSTCDVKISDGPYRGEKVEKDMCMRLDMNRCVKIKFINDSYYNPSQVYRVTFKQDGRKVELQYDTKGSEGWFHSGNLRWNTACPV